MKKAVLTIGAIGVVVACYLVSDYFASEEEAQADSRPEEETVRVESAVAEVQPMRELVTYPGSVMAQETVAIAPKVAGLIEKIHVEFGDQVEKGEVLVEIDDGEYVERRKQAQANLQLAQAQLRQAETRYEHAKVEFNRVDRSGQEGIASQQERDSARANRDSAEAEVEVARAEVERMRAALEEAELSVRNCTIVSPLTGWVQGRHADPGALAATGTEVLTLVDTDPAEVVIYLPERDLHIAELGREATVRLADEGGTFKGTVSRVAPTLSMSTRTTRVIVEVPNTDQRLRPGMSTEVSMISEDAPNALTVPMAAVVFQNEQNVVYRIEDGRAYPVTVELGLEEGNTVQIVSGLNEGDRVVTKGQFMLRDGQPVESVTNTQAHTSAETNSTA